MAFHAHRSPLLRLSSKAEGLFWTIFYTEFAFETVPIPDHCLPGDRLIRRVAYLEGADIKAVLTAFTFFIYHKGHLTSTDPVGHGPYRAEHTPDAMVVKKG